MRIRLITATTAFAVLVLGGLAAAAPTATPTRGWTNPQYVGGLEDYTSLEIAPDGYAVAWIFSRGCGDCGQRYELRVRTPGGRWTESDLPADAEQPPYFGPYSVDVEFDSSSNGWAVWQKLPSADATEPTLMISRRPAGGVWSAGEAVPGLSSGKLLLTSAGLPVVYSNSTPAADGSRTLKLATLTSSGWTTTARTIPGIADLIAGPDGTVRAAWRSADGHQALVSDRGADGTWSQERAVLQSEAVLNLISWVGPHALRFEGSSTGGQTITSGVLAETSTGLWEQPATRVRLLPADFGGPGDLATLAGTDGSQVVVIQQRATGGWSGAVPIGRGQDPEVTVDRRGNVTVLWVHYDSRGFSSVRYAQRPVNGSWTPARALPKPVASPSGVYESVIAGVDGAGTVTVGASGNVNGVRGLYSADLAAPVAVTTVNRSPSRGWATASSFRVGWTTTWDRATSHDARYRERRVTSTHHTQHQLVAGSKATSAAVAGQPGRVYCVAARAHLATTTGPWGTKTCVATPLDDRSLRATKEWKRAAGSTTRTRGATLTSPRLHGTRFALAVHPSANAGTVRVTLGGKRLGTFKLTKGDPRRTRIIGLRAFPTTQHAKLVITVVSTGKPVRIDGIYAR